MARPWTPVDPGAHPDWSLAVAALRDRMRAGGWSQQALARASHASRSTLSDVLGGRTMPSAEVLDAVLRALRVEREETARLRRLRDRVVEERRAQSRERRSAAESAHQATRISGRLKDLQETVGCSVRDLVEMTAEAGVTTSKSSIARVLDDPARDPALVYALADSMVRMLPREERQRAYTEACLPALDLLRGKAHGDLHADNILLSPVQTAVSLIDMSSATAGDREADMLLPDGTIVEVKVHAAGPSQRHRGLGEPPEYATTSTDTADAVIRSLQTHGPMTGGELAQRLGCTVRHLRLNLEALIADDIVEARPQQVYGSSTRGRAAKVFALTGKTADRLSVTEPGIGRPNKPSQQYQIRWPDGTTLTVRGQGIDKQLLQRAEALGAEIQRVPTEGTPPAQDAPSASQHRSGGMDAFTRSLLERIRATESDLTRAREEGDDFLAEVEQDELDDLRPQTAEHGIEEPLDAPQLTDRELTVARLASQGHSNREIASTLFLSVSTVENLLSGAYAKLGVHSRGELTRHVR